MGTDNTVIYATPEQGGNLTHLVTDAPDIEFAEQGYVRNQYLRILDVTDRINRKPSLIFNIVSIENELNHQ
jgi:hypothetical protein